MEAIPIPVCSIGKPHLHVLADFVKHLALLRKRVRTSNLTRLRAPHVRRQACSRPSCSRVSAVIMAEQLLLQLVAHGHHEMLKVSVCMIEKDTTT
jgi:hypothetical protein